MSEFPIVCMLGEYIKSRGYKSVLYMPYIPNARMDRIHKGDVFTLKYFAKMLNAVGFAEIHTLDAHSDVSVGLLDNCINYQPIVAIKKAIILSEPDFIYFPDAGVMSLLFISVAISRFFMEIKFVIGALVKLKD